MSIPAFMSVDSTICTISRFVATGERNELGEPVKSLDVIAEGVICAIDAVVNKQTGTIRSAVDMFHQGEIEASHYKMTVSNSVDVQAGDFVTDPDGIEYQVDSIAKFSSHKEARLIVS